jgi:hypothetical protein
MSGVLVIFAPAQIQVSSTDAGHPVRLKKWRFLMKKMIFALMAVVSLGVSAANAQSFSHESPPHQQSGGQFGSVKGGS